MTNKPIHLLLIEDNPGDARLIRELLAERGNGSLHLDWADRLEKGLERLEAGGIDLVLLDLSLPGSQGLDTLAKVLEHAPCVPIVVLTGLDDEVAAVEAVHRGAQDYLTKGQINAALLVRAARYAIERKRTEQKLGEMNVRLEEANRRLEELSVTDDLTGLYNRRRFHEILEQELQRVQRYGTPLAVAMFDIDHFKTVNDTHGHAAGDRVLVAVARFLERGARAADTVARYGGEEFIILMPDTPAAEAFIATERIRKQMAQHAIVVGAHTLRVTLSAGVAALGDGIGQTSDALVRAADEALYAAKQAGRNCTKTWGETAIPGTPRRTPPPRRVKS
ncbi:MAG TPA: diguanylate cyclase [Phycisphaerae bacterium]|nr:diguanylate cyclase [Phycisphaerae bacterium]